MPELQWALIGLGAVFLVGLALWEWRRSRRRPTQGTATISETQPAADRTDRPRRFEPGIEGLVAFRGPGRDDDFDVPVIHPVEPVPVAAESAVDIPSAARRPEPAVVPPLAGALPVASPVAIRWPPQQADRVLSLRVSHPQGELLSGRQLRNALESAAFLPGPQTIYHRIDAEGAVLVSVASMVRPGNLDPALMDAQQFRGLSLFSVLPGPLPAARLLEELVAAARLLADRLGAIVQDEQGAELDAARLTSLRQSLPDDGGIAGAGTEP